jgi:hypothetical protein
MRTMAATATVTEDGQLIAPAPPDLPAGQHRVVIVIEEQASDTASESLEAPFDLPVHDLGPWPPTLSLRREHLYDD